MKTRPVKATSETHKRSFTVTRAEPSETDDRTVELAFASDIPCEHFSYKLWDFIDVKLSMESRRCGRIDCTNGAALLADHDPTDQIGVVESFSIDSKDGKARATVRFSKSHAGRKFTRTCSTASAETSASDFPYTSSFSKKRTRTATIFTVQTTGNRSSSR
jgi:hypothetical protein